MPLYKGKRQKIEREERVSETRRGRRTFKSED